MVSPPNRNEAILTFDIEDWFHILDHPATENVGQWSDFQSRVVIGTERILAFCKSRNVKATFFYIGMGS